MPADAGQMEERAAAADLLAGLFTVPSACPFLPTLATAVLSGDLPRAGGRPPSPLDLPDYTILLPTVRAARALQHAFLEAADGRRAMLLPKIRSIADGEEDLTLLAGLAQPSISAPGIEDVPPAIGELERRLVLTELVLRWSETMRHASREGGKGRGPHVAAGAETPAQAANLARELARLIDMVEIEGAELGSLAGLVPESFSEHWQKTLKFLEIVLDWWPRHLAEGGLLSPMDRRNRTIRAEAERLMRNPPAAPYIVAGVTGSIPATADLMRVVSKLELGAIVLPGLDTEIDEESWRLLPDHPEHPQHGLAKLLGRLGAARKDVRCLSGAKPQGDGFRRELIVNEALRPAATTHLWRGFVGSTDASEARRALRGVALIEAATAHEEAEAIALILREALEVPGRTAALVTPDRLLARRVTVRLESWGIRVDDSAGRPFGKTVPGTFLDLVIDAASRDFAPAELMALLRHPMTRLGLSAAAVRRAARTLELIAFRTEYLGRGLDGVEAAITNAHRRMTSGARRQRHIQRLRQADWEAARDLVSRLREAFAPLAEAFADAGHIPLARLVRAHVTSAEALARVPEPDQPGASPLWQGEAGEAAALLFAGLLQPDLMAPSVAAAEYPDLYRSLIADENVRPKLPAHPRLSIWGPLEARLQRPDIVVLGSLNEGTWPETTEPGPWLNRPMRNALGLPQPEERIGRAAHDFAQLLGAGRVYLTRAQKVEGAPTVASRWLLRLQALLKGLGLDDALDPAEPWLGWARARDTVAASGRRLDPPAPCPPVALRPRRLGVSDVERWMANPYAVFAKHILDLERLPDLGAEPGPALRGAIIHEALGRFAARYPDRLPDDPGAELMAIARSILVEYTGSPRVAAFWIPRLERFARWFGETEPVRRQGVTRTLAEVSGAHVMAAPAGPFTMTARADRIDVTGSGLIITDYKSSGIKSLATRAAKGHAPQLPLEAVIAREGGFSGLDPSTVAGLRYIIASGGEPPGVEIPLKADKIFTLVDDARAGLARLVNRFDLDSTPYRAVRRAHFDYRYDDFAHLARVKEWTAGSPQEGGDE